MKPSGMTFEQAPPELPGVQNDCASDSEDDTSSSTKLTQAEREHRNTERTYRRAAPGEGGRTLFRR